MENWRQDRYNDINKALERIQHRAEKIVRAVNAPSDGDEGRRQQQQKAATLTNELARLQDMNDRLVDFRDRLYFYSNLGYVEALNEWDYEIRKICVKAEGFVNLPHKHHHKSRHHRNHSHGHGHSHRHRSSGRENGHSRQPQGLLFS